MEFPTLSVAQYAYVSVWSALALGAGVFVIVDRKDSPLFDLRYYSALFRPWKIASFVLATSILCWLSTLGYDPTWDIPETLAMSVMTFSFAPYSVGTIYRFAKRVRRKVTELFTAVVLTFFVSAWFYDAYATLFLLGEYPRTAFSNLGLSPFFYVLAGIFWSLECYGDRPTISFSRPEWFGFQSTGKCFFSILPTAVPIIVFMVAIFWRFAYLSR